MTEKFDKRAGKNGGIPSGSAGRHSDDWDDFLTEFRSDGDIAVRSLEDLGLDDDFALSELQNSGGGSGSMGHTSRFDKLKPGAEKYSADPQDGAPPEEDLDLSIFDELDVLLNEEKESPSQKADHDTALRTNTSEFSSEAEKTSAPDAEGAGKAAEGADEPVGRKNSPGKADSDGLEEEPGGKRADAADTPSAGAEPAGEDSGTGGGSSSNSGESSPSGPAADLQSKDLTGPEDPLLSNRGTARQTDNADTDRETQAAADKPLLPAAEAENDKTMDKETKPKKKRKSGDGGRKKPLWRRIIHWIIILLIACIIAGAAYVGFVVFTSPEIDPDNIYGDLQQTSKIFDDQGELLEYVDASVVRTNVTYDQIPENLINAFVAVEDKTFFEHNGFNYVRILGAIAESIFTDKDVSGTSTITQQLARNLYLTTERSMTRKIREAYYTIILEKNLTKEQIIEAYLNTISLGYSAYGVQAAADAYFGCELQDLTIAQCAALASIPKSPSKYALMKNYYNEDVTADSEDILLVGDTFTTVYNDAFKDRQQIVLKFMLEQGKISQQEYEEALAEDIKASLRPTEDKQTVSSYFADYCLDEVRRDLIEEYNLNENTVEDLINSGIYIYSTLDVEMQQIAEAEFSKSSNYPSIRSMRTDSSGNMIDKNGNVVMYKKSSYFNSDDSFTLKYGEFGFDEEGNLILYAGQRLKFYTVKGAGGNSEEQIEFSKLHYTEGGILYNINGGVISGIDSQYKTKDADGNVIISKEFIDSDKNIFIMGDGTITINPEHYTLRQETIQPQGAMVVTDITTGQIKVMVGGRSLKGRLLYNRADNPRQPGSSIKPIGVYGPALQSGVDLDTGWTAGSTIEDKPNYVNGKLWPKNSNNKYDGWITLRTCVEQSKNVPSVNLVNDIGYDYSIDFLKKNGVTTVVEDGDTNDKNPAALALGGMSKGISPIEMASAYATFPNQGVHVEPTTYTKVTDSQGNVLLESQPEETRVFDESVAFIMTDILRTTVTNGIAGRAAIGVAPVGGKTGTTNDNYDAWFVGFTPQYAASVWIGNDVNIELSQGSSAAASLWSKVMRQIAPKGETTRFPSQPSDVYMSGGEYYVKGTSRTGPAVSGLDEEPEVLYDETGKAYIIDPDTGEKIYVTVDPDTGKVTPTTGTPSEDPDNPDTSDPNDPGGTGDPSNPGGATDPNNPSNPGTTDPNDPGGNTDPNNPGGATDPSNPGGGQTNPPGVVDD